MKLTKEQIRDKLHNWIDELTEQLDDPLEWHIHGWIDVISYIENQLSNKKYQVQQIIHALVDDVEQEPYDVP